MSTEVEKTEQQWREELSPADVHVGAARAVRAVALDALLLEDLFAACRVAVKRPCIELGARPVVPFPQERDHGVYVVTVEWPAA